jgi:hypothetical protein
MRDAGVRTLMTGTFGDPVMGNLPLDVTSIAWALRMARPVELFRQLRAWGLASQRTAWQLLSMATTEFRPVRVEAHAHLKTFIENWAADGGLSSRGPTTVLSDRTLELLLESNTVSATWSRQEEHPHVSRRFLRSLAYDMLSGRLTSPPESPYLVRAHPYRDRRLIEYVCAIPWSTMCEPGRPRALMREAFGSMLPERISRRFSKAVMSACQARRVVSLAPIVLERSATAAVVDRGYVKADVWASYLEKCRSGTFKCSDSMLGICVLEFWLSRALSEQAACV